MRHLPSSLGIAPLFVAVLVVQSDPSWAATEPNTVQPIAPPAVNTRNSAVFLPAAPPQVAPAAKQSASEASTPSPSGAATAAKAGDPGKPSSDPNDVEMIKLKHQIKTTRLSLADTQGRLVVTEKDLSTASAENAQLRSDSTNLRVGLTKAETIAKKSEEELVHRRQEVKTLQTRSTGTGTLVVVLLLCLTITGMLAVVLWGHGGKLRAILSHLHDTKVDDRRADQLRAELKEAQQRSQRFEEESQRLRAAADSQANAPAGSKREKLDQLRRQVRDAQSAAEAEKRRADERIEQLEAEMASISSEKQEASARLRRLEAEMAELTAAKQELFNKVQNLEPEMAQLASDRLEAEGRSRALAHDVARLTAEKLRLEHALAKANEKLAFFGHDEPEDTLPPVVG